MQKRCSAVTGLMSNITFLLRYGSAGRKIFSWSPQILNYQKIRNSLLLLCRNLELKCNSCIKQGLVIHSQKKQPVR